MVGFDLCGLCVPIMDLLLGVDLQWVLVLSVMGLEGCQWVSVGCELHCYDLGITIDNSKNIIIIINKNITKEHMDNTCQTNFWFSKLLEYCFLKQFLKSPNTILDNTILKAISTLALAIVRICGANNIIMMCNSRNSMLITFE